MAEQNVNLILKQEEHHNDEEVVISFTTLFRKLKRYFAVWLLVSILVGGLIAGASMFFTTTSSNPVRAVVSFNYKGIEKGKNPDGTVFDWNTLKAPRIIEEALEECNMDPELLEPVRRGMVIEGKMPEDAYQRLNTYRNVLENSTTGQLAAANAMLDVSWFSTQYNLELNYKEAELRRTEAVQLLNAMLEAYRRYFYEKYGYNEALGIALSAMDYRDYDYAEAVDMFRSSLKQLNRYVTSLANDDSTRFRSSETGYTFADLKTAINTVSDLDLDLISSYLSVNNITKDKVRLQAYYEYRIENLERQQITDKENLAAVEAAFDSYEKDQVIIFSDSVANTETTVSSEEYDKLINRRISAQASLSETNESISYYKQRLQTLKKTTIANSEDKVERIEKDLEKVNKKVNDLIELVEKTADDYYENVSLVNSYRVLVPATYDAATTVKNGVSKAIVPAVGAEALIFIAYLGYCFVIGISEGTKKKNAEQKAAKAAAAGGDQPKNDSGKEGSDQKDADQKDAGKNDADQKDADQKDAGKKDAGKKK